LVDEKTTALLTLDYVTKHQHSKSGKRLPRSMGDVWLETDGIYHAINVKACVTGGAGQPNMVSLKKVLKAVLSRQIDSYYLLIVKIEDSTDPTCSVFLVDMLDYLDYVTFDAGPGQIMLKASAFFAAMKSGVPPSRADLKSKVNRLMDLLEDAVERLIANREKDLNWYRRRVDSYLEGDPEGVTPQSQEALNLQ